MNKDKLDVKLADFGISLQSSKSSNRQVSFVGSVFTVESGSFAGTVGYAAPETMDLLNTDLSKKADVYSLGVVLDQLSTGLLEPRILADKSMRDEKLMSFEDDHYRFIQETIEACKE